MKQKKLILHTGFPKTATTSIQETLFRNKKLLEEQNIYYPEFVKTSFRRWKNHGPMLLSLFSEQPEKLSIYIRWPEKDISAANVVYREQFERVLARKDCTVLISAESIAGRSPELLKKIASAIRKYGWSIEVIATVRSPLSAFVSTYANIIKSIPILSTSLSDYQVQASASRRLENLRSVFDTVRTYPFSDACGHPRGPVGYFLDFLGIENANNFEIFKKNEGSSNNAIRLLRYVAGFEPLVVDGKKNPNRHEHDLECLWTIPGPKFHLTWEEYETVREQIEFENAWLESNLGREYCDEEIELRCSDVHWDEGSLRAVRNALPEVPEVLAPYVHRYFAEEQGIVLLSECRSGPDRSEDVVRSVDEKLRAGQLDDDSAVELLRSVIGDDKDDRRLYDRACELLLQMGKTKEAVCLAEEGLARFGGDLALMSRLAYAYAAEGETDRALVQWARVRQAHPSAEAGWIEGAMCSAALGFESEACELLGAYLAQLEGRLSRPWWDRILRVVEVILLEYCEDLRIPDLLETLFFRLVAPDLDAYLELFHKLNQVSNYKRFVQIVDLLKDIHRRSPIKRDDDQAVALELALGIAVERESLDRIQAFLIGLSFHDFCRIFAVRCRPNIQYNFLDERGDIQEMIAELPVTDPDNAKKCLAMRYTLGMDYSAAYEALTGLPLPTADNYYSDFAYAAYTGKGRPKVAFCVSGKLRGYREAFASWKKARLFADCDVSIFVHTWPEVGATGFNPNIVYRMFGGNFLQAFVKECNMIIEEFNMTRGKYSSEKLDKFGKVYPNLLRVAAESQEVVSAEKLSKFYGTPHVVVEPEEPYRNYTNAEKMYYKIQACWELACASGEEFHFVFRARPDLALHDDSEVDWCEIVARSQNERIVYTNNKAFIRMILRGLYINDQLGFGNPAAMAVYSSTWDRTKYPNGLIRTHSDYVLAHTTLALSLVEREVKAVTFPKGFVMGKLLYTDRPSLESLREALEKDLAPSDLHQNPMWLALEEDISREIQQGGR